MSSISDTRNMAHRQAIGANLRYIREQKQLTQKHVADMAGVARQHYGDIESGKANFTINILFQISNALEIQPAEALKFEDQNKPTALLTEETRTSLANLFTGFLQTGLALFNQAKKTVQEVLYDPEKLISIRQALYYECNKRFIFERSLQYLHQRHLEAPEKLIYPAKAIALIEQTPQYFSEKSDQWAQKAVANISSKLTDLKPQGGELTGAQLKAALNLRGNDITRVENEIAAFIVCIKLPKNIPRGETESVLAEAAESINMPVSRFKQYRRQFKELEKASNTFKNNESDLLKQYALKLQEQFFQQPPR